MPGQASKAHQVPSLGPSPAEVRAQMKGSDASPPPSRGAILPPVPGVPTEVSRAIEGFGEVAPEAAVVEERAGDEAAPSPSKAMEMIRQLSQDRLQANAERDAALGLVEKYRSLYGDMD